MGLGEFFGGIGDAIGGAATTVADGAVNLGKAAAWWDPPKSEEQKEAEKGLKSVEAKEKAASKADKAADKELAEAKKSKTISKDAIKHLEANAQKTQANIDAARDAKSAVSKSIKDAEAATTKKWAETNPGASGMRNGIQQSAGYVCAGTGCALGAVGGVFAAPFTGGMVNPVNLGAAGLAGGSAIGAAISPEGSVAKDVLSAITPVALTTAAIATPGVGLIGTGAALTAGSISGNITSNQGGFVNKATLVAAGTGVAMMTGGVSAAMAPAAAPALAVAAKAVGTGLVFGGGSVAGLNVAGRTFDGMRKTQQNYGDDPGVLEKALGNFNVTERGIADAQKYADDKYAKGEREDLGSAAFMGVTSAAGETLDLGSKLLNIPWDAIKKALLIGGGALAALWGGSKVIGAVTSKKKKSSEEPAQPAQPAPSENQEMMEMMKMQMMMNMQQQQRQARPPAQDYSPSTKFTGPPKK